jgi:hypothetical protein
MFAPSTFTRHLMMLSAITVLAGCSRPTPAPTATPVAVVEASESGYRDDFSDPSSGWRKSWPRILETPYGAEYLDGAYRVWVDNDQGTYDIVVATSGRTFDDVRLEVDVQRTLGVGFAGAFLVCRFDPASGSFYYFKLDGDGMASIGIYLDGEEQRVVFKEVPAALLNGEWVRFGAGCLGSTLTVTVGGETIFELEETSLQGGEVGLGAGEGDEGRTEILFDNFIAQPPESAGTAVAGLETPSAIGAEEEVRLITEPPPPSGLIDSLLERVAAGEWTYEQALIAGLKLLVGESDLDAAVGPQVPFSLEGTGVVLEARRYLQTGTDSPARAELTRLLDILSPGQDRLDEYASPADEAALRVPGLASPFLADETCTDLANQGFPPGSKVKCLLYVQQAIVPGTARIYYPATWGKDAPQLKYTQAALQALQDSWARYTKLGTGIMGDVRVVFTLIAAKAPKYLAEVISEGASNTCVVLVYPLALSDSEAVFKQTIAHEAFHCYQAWNFPKHFNASWAVQDWWGESTAEYFSNVVYPTVNAEWGRLQEFDSASAFKSLLDMSYENESFFQYLATQIGDGGILDLIAKLPTQGGTAEQTKALAAYPMIQTLFRDFGTAYVDGQIVDTSKAKMPSGPLGVPEGFTPTLGPTSPSKANLPTWTFTLARYLVTFAPGNAYAVDAKEAGDPGAYAARRLGLTGSWAGFPAKTAAGCKKDTYYVLVTSSTPPGTGPSYSVDVTATVEHEAGCDPCLNGKWRLEHESLADFLGAPFAATPGVFQFVDGGGFWLYTFFSNGGLAANINYALGYKLIQGSETLPHTTHVVLTMEGEGAGTYWVKAPGTLGLLGASSTLKMEQDIAINGQTVISDSPIPLDPFPKGASTATYECTPATLVFWPSEAEQAGLPPLSFERFGNAP